MGSFPDPVVRLSPVLPEIALLGRSNVGKSSLINALIGRRLARVSATPGKTTMLNVFRFPGWYLIDLPGYGYAQADRSSREAYRVLVEGFLSRREGVTGIIWLLDVRREPSPDDQRFQALLARRGTPVLVALTKCDKLSRAALARRIEELALALELPTEQLIPTSAVTGAGITELGESLLAAAG